MSTAVATAPALTSVGITMSATASRLPSSAPNSHSPPNNDGSRLRKPSSEDKRSPNHSRTPHIPKVIVKEEPSSPSLTTTRHRPRKLDLSGHNKVPAGALSARPLTSKDALLDVGIACLSPGFNTSNPQMQQQLQRSMDVREQQRLIIEARQKGQKVPDMDQPPKTGTDSLFRPNKVPQSSRRKGPPPALSIAPPHHGVFANERVIQSAPLGASFTGLNRNPEGPPARQATNQRSNLSHTSHVHHTPAIQTANRLPPIGDIFPSELQSNGQLRNGPTSYTLSPGQSNQPLTSPGYPPHFQSQQKSHVDAAAVAAQQKHIQVQHATQKNNQAQSQRPREYKSAEEAVRALVGGRDELLPRLVHYGGHQPPTPPSPASKHVGLGLQGEQQSRTSSASGARRRDREEYEADAGTPPLGRQARRPGPFGLGRDSPQSVAAKKEQFMKLMEQAWDLFHS